MSEIPAVSRLTSDAALLLSEQLGREIKYQALFWLIKTSQIDAPPKDRAGNYRWLDQHLDAARVILAARKPRVKLK